MSTRLEADVVNQQWAALRARIRHLDRQGDGTPEQRVFDPLSGWEAAEAHGPRRDADCAEDANLREGGSRGVPRG